MLTSALSVSTTAGCSFLTIEKQRLCRRSMGDATHAHRDGCGIRSHVRIHPILPQWNCDYSGCDPLHPPLPMPTPGPEHVYKEKLAQGSFEIQKCAGCGKHVFYPRVLCPHCGADKLGWVAASGAGTIYSTTVVRRKA